MDKRREFESIVRENSEQLYWQIRRIVLTHDDANDVLQNTFLKAWNAFDSFHGESKVSTWLSRIAINESLDFLRRNNHPTISTQTAATFTEFYMKLVLHYLSLFTTLLGDKLFDIFYRHIFTGSNIFPKQVHHTEI